MNSTAKELKKLRGSLVKLPKPYSTYLSIGYQKEINVMLYRFTEIQLTEYSEQLCKEQREIDENIFHDIYCKFNKVSFISDKFAEEVVDAIRNAKAPL